MQHRSEPRFKKRIPCRVERGDSLYSGVVLDLSRTGLFVQTGASANPGDEIGVVLSSELERTGIQMRARVVWQRRVPAQLRSVAEGGFGLAIRSAPESYYALLASAARVPASGPGRG